ncbi:MAG: PilN domain-containing protein [Gammaproteobacteria bacterium]|nr:PilN domain-containing protein [Gammaproteobacteria bacterium]
MPQNINLLEELTIKKIYAFNSRLITQISLGWILLLILIYILAIGINADRKKTILKLEVVQKTIETKINSYNQILLPLKENVLPDVKTLPSGSINFLGFYRYLEDLAKFTPHGVWLTNIVFSEPNELVTIQGSAIIASSVSALINSLSKSDDFKNKKFDALQLRENISTGNTDFTISTLAPTTIETNEDE